MTLVPLKTSYPSAHATTADARILFTTENVEGKEARGTYGPLVLKGYLVLVLVIITVPLLSLIALALLGRVQDFAVALKGIQDYAVALLAASSGLSGLAGLVVGRYFSSRTN